MIPANQTVIISTDADTIQGGPNGFPTNQQAIIGGIINVRDLRVEQGARVTFIGSNTVTILATGNVDIDGVLSVDGGDNPGVGTLNTTNQPELGASGGTPAAAAAWPPSVPRSRPRAEGPASVRSTSPASVARAVRPGYAPGGSCAKDNRRGAGGGGGALGDDIRFDWQGGLPAVPDADRDGHRARHHRFAGRHRRRQPEPARSGRRGRAAAVHRLQRREQLLRHLADVRRSPDPRRTRASGPAPAAAAVVAARWRDDLDPVHHHG